jgi:transposase
MAKPYSDDLRARVIAAIEEGATREEAAERHDVSLSSVGRFVRLKRDTGSVSPAKFGGYKPYVLAAHEQLVRGLLAQQPDITLAELQATLAKRKVAVGQTSIFRFLRHLKLTFKKKACTPPSRTGRTSRPIARPCSAGNQDSMQSDWFSSMKPPSAATSPASMGAPRAARVWSRRCCMAIGRQQHSSLRCVTTVSARRSCSKAR